MSFYRLLQRDLLLAVRQRANLAQPILFFIIVNFLFFFTAANNSSLISFVPGIVWVTLFLSILLSLDNLFREDYEDGSLEQLLLTSSSVTLTVLARLITNWVTTSLPIILAAIFLAIVMQLNFSTMLILTLSLLLGTPSLMIIGAIITALLTGLPRNGVLLTLLVLPLYIPILIFGVLATRNAMFGLVSNSEVAMLAAVFIISITFGPIAIVNALKIGID